MTDEQRKQIDELLAAGRDLTKLTLSPVFSLNTGWKIGRIHKNTAEPLNLNEDAEAVNFGCDAANAREALAAMVAENAAMREGGARLVEALEWALDIIDLNDKRLSEIDPEWAARLDHAVDFAAKTKARIVLGAARRALAPKEADNA